MRDLPPVLSRTAKVISISFALFYLYSAGFGIFSSQSHRGLYLLFTFLLCILWYPAIKKGGLVSKVGAVIDVVLFAGASISIIYWMIEYSAYAADRVGWPNQWDFIFGAVLIVVCLEVTRRVMGYTLTIIGLIFVAQLYFGPYLPGDFSHKGMPLTRIIEFNYSTMEGIFGTVLSVFATYVMPFIIFGAFLQRSGGGDFFIDLARSLAGGVSGGPALIAVWGSAAFGSISGSPVANVVSTGSFTIPMMKRVGFSSEFAGAVEASASTGGQFLPPIMGAAAFILATLTETSYSVIVIMAIVPALLYYLSLSFMVYARAKLDGISGLDKDQLPKLGDVIRKGWYFAFILVVAVYLIVAGYSPPVVAFWATLFVFICSFFRKETRPTIEKTLEILMVAGKNSLTVGSVVGTLGLIMGGITLSGLGVTFSKLLLSVSGGSIFITIVLIAIIATIVGMGLPTAASYIVLAILAAPSLVQLGVPLVNAHMLCFWLAMTSNITPPVCVAAYAASSVSGGDPMKTGFHACRLGIFLYLCPFAFIYAPEIMLLGDSTIKIIFTISAYLICTLAIAAALQGWLFKRLAAWERGVYLSCVILLISNNPLLVILGAITLISMLSYGCVLIKRKNQIVANIAD